MKVLAGAQPFGFGPVSKLVSISAHFQRIPITFVGEGIALRYARLNNRHFAATKAFALDQPPRVRLLVQEYDAVISVMEPRLVFAAKQAGIPVYFFDSLLGFWQIGRDIRELQSMADAIATETEHSTAAILRALSVHEQMIVAHMVSTRSFAQAFPGVAAWIVRFAALGIHRVEVSGPIIDVTRPGAEPQRRASRTMVVNLGGFNNAFIDADSNGAYIDIMLRWLRKLAARTNAFDRILVGSGAFAASFTEYVGSTEIAVGLVPNAALLNVLSGNPVYLIAPGLTSLQEAVALSVLPMLLPEQHYGHIRNRARLSGHLVAELGCCFSDLGFDTRDLAEDRSATLALAAVAARIRDEPALFETWAGYMDDKLKRFLTTPQADIATELDRLRDMLNGRTIGSVVDMIQQEILNAPARDAC